MSLARREDPRSADFYSCRARQLCSALSVTQLQARGITLLDNLYTSPGISTRGNAEVLGRVKRRNGEITSEHARRTGAVPRLAFGAISWLQRGEDQPIAAVLTARQ
jgi:hypothetical protein